MSQSTLILDFDSTIVCVEALDELARLVVGSGEEGARITSEIEEITRLGMDGSITLQESLARRFSLIRFSQANIARLIEHLNTQITTSLLALAPVIHARRDRIHVVSGGFQEWVAPVCETLGIRASHCHANTFRFSHDGFYLGMDEHNPLGKTGGKPIVIEALALSRPILLVGDGVTDLEARTRGAVDWFIAYTEHVHREAVTRCADATASDFADVLSRWDLLDATGSISSTR
ncbi:MAG: HAD-IB family phosphatase [Planctomycetota bacterium]|nr:HAD-IB family phosphatase [Planctomycetota bacterium]